MITILPFKAVRPASGMESVISELPYDVYSRKEATEIVKRNNKSFLKIDRAETSFDDSVGTYDDLVYKKAYELYEAMKAEGAFVKDNKACLYLYELTMAGRTQTGIVACASCEEYGNNLIKKHENTRSDKEIDRIKHVSALSAQTGPIFLAYRKNDELAKIIADYKESNIPYMDFVSSDNIIHRGWAISDDSIINKITECFAHIDSLYVADGHHRLASAYKVSRNNIENKEAQYFLSVIFSDDELMIMDYNRVVKDLNGLTISDFVSKISKRFYVTEIPVTDDKPLKKGDIYMFIGDKEYLINLKEDYFIDDPIKSLDVSILQDNILSPILGINDPKTDNRIDFIGGIRGISELRKRLSTDSKVAFAMYPTQMSELFKVADNNLLMPPKSTWFEPKLRSGLFIHEF